MNFKYETCMDAASENDFEELKKMHQSGCSLFKTRNGWSSISVSEMSIYRNNFEMFKYAISNGCKTFRIYEVAGKKGYLEFIKYAYENGVEWGDYPSVILNNIVQNGHVDCLKYVLSHGLQPYENISADARHIKMLQYIHEHVQPMTSEVTTNTSCYDLLDCLKYAHENGVDCEEEALYWCVYHGWMECMIFILDHWNLLKEIEPKDKTFVKLYPKESNIKYTYLIIAYKNHNIDIFEYLIERLLTEITTKSSTEILQTIFNLPFRMTNYNGSIEEVDKETIELFGRDFYNKQEKRMLDLINLDKPLWRKILSLDHKTNPHIQEKINKKKEEIKTLVLNNLVLSKDMIQYCIFIYL